MRVLGIDLSKSATGLAMIEPVLDCAPELPNVLACAKTVGFFQMAGQQFCYHGNLIIPRSTNVLTCWEEILLPILDWAQHAQHVIIEGYAFSSFGQGVTALAEIKGIVCYHLRKLGKIPIAIAPASLKKFVTDNGRAKKPEMVKAIREIGPSIHDHNMADAFGLAQIGCGMYQAGLELPRHQAELIERIKHPEDKAETAKRKKILQFEKANAKANSVH